MTKKEQTKVVSAYKQQKVSLGQAAERLEMSVGKTRQFLVDAGAEIRPRGRPRKS